MTVAIERLTNQDNVDEVTTALVRAASHVEAYWLAWTLLPNTLRDVADLAHAPQYLAPGARKQTLVFVAVANARGMDNADVRGMCRAMGVAVPTWAYRD